MPADITPPVILVPPHDVMDRITADIEAAKRAIASLGTGPIVYPTNRKNVEGASPTGPSTIHRLDGLDNLEDGEDA